MCNGSASKAQQFLKQKSHILRSTSDVILPLAESVAKADGVAKRRSASHKVANRPWSALEEGTRPLSAQKNVRRPISAQWVLGGPDSDSDKKFARFQDALVARRGASVQKRKKPRDPFKDFLSDDPRITEILVERTMEDAHVRSCKNILHHKAILGKLDAVGSKQHSKAAFAPAVAPAERVLPPVTGLHKLQQHIIQSHKDLCETNPEAMDSFIDKVEERRRQRQKESQESKQRDMLNRSSVDLAEFKSMLKAVRNPKSELEIWNTAEAARFRNEAAHFRSRFHQHHDHAMLENLDVAQAVRIYQAIHQ